MPLQLITTVTPHVL